MRTISLTSCGILKLDFFPFICFTLSILLFFSYLKVTTTVSRTLSLLYILSKNLLVLTLHLYYNIHNLQY